MLVLKGSSFLQDGDLRVRGERGVELAYHLFHGTSGESLAIYRVTPQ